VHQAKLYTRPAKQPKLLCAAISEQTAAWAGEWADGLLTTADKTEEMTKKKIRAFNDAAGQNKSIFLQFAFSYARTRKDAEQGAFDQWRSNILPKDRLAGLSTVKQFDEAGQSTTMQEVLEAIPVFTNMQTLQTRIDELATTGADRIILHNINRQQEDFINDFGVAKKNN